MPRKGFETRGTPLANERLALQELIRRQASFYEILNFESRPKRDTEKLDLSAEKTETLLIGSDENITVNFDEYGVDYEPKAEDMNSPCIQYAGFVKYNSSGFSDALSKAIFEISSFDELFNINTLKSLCAIDSLIEEIFAKGNFHESYYYLSHGKFTLKFSFNLPYYVGCFSNSTYSKNCANLTQFDADNFKQQFLMCLDPANKTDLVCSSMTQQLENYILQKPKRGLLGTPIIPKGPIYVATILPIHLYFNDPNKKLDFYNELWHCLESYYDNKPNIRLKGIDFNTKEAVFEKALFNDCYLGILALVLIALSIFVYSKSVAFTLIIISGMLLSIGASFFIYSTVLGINFFPFINLLVFIIGIAVGADDAFIFLSAYKQTHRKFVNVARNKLNANLCSLPRCESKGSSYELNESWLTRSVILDPTMVLHYALMDALDHAAMAMFVTSATTAVAFLANYFSNILILKCFGIFASITILTNYVFVVTALPASILILNQSLCHETSSRSNGLFGIFRRFVDWLKEIYIYKLSVVIYRLSIPISMAMFVVGAFAIYTIVITPGIRLPKNNPLQILRSSNPFEWFAENEPSLFGFSSKREIFHTAYALFGVQSNRDASNFIVDDVGTIAADQNFKLDTLAKFQSLEKVFDDFVKLPFLKIAKRNTIDLWLTKFLFWTKNCNKTETVCCGLNENTENYSYNECFLKYAQKSSMSFMPRDLSLLTKAVDGPIFDKNGGQFLGYYFAAPTTYQYQLIYDDLQPVFKNLSVLQDLAKDEGFSNTIIIATPYATQIFDILNTLLNGTMLSVLASVAVSAAVIVLTTWRLCLTILAVLCITWTILCVIAFVLLLGKAIREKSDFLLDWTINVLEATIIVLTIGLSFDYTLHIAIAYKSAPDFVVNEKIVHALKNVGVAVFLSAATNFLAGLAMIWAKTHAFFEIGVFLITMTDHAAVLIFPALIFTVSLCYNGKI